MSKFFTTSTNVKRDSFIWNTISSTLLAGMSALLLVVVVRTLNDLDAAIFSLGFSIAQMMLTIGYFDMRAFQVTDVAKKYDFNTYLSSRLITCVIMIGFSFIYVIIKEYDIYKATIILLLCFFKMIDAVEDVFHGELQLHGRLDIAAKLQSFRVLISIVVFSLCLVISYNLMLSLILTTIISILIVFTNIPIMRQYTELKLSKQYTTIYKLLLTCLPLFIGSYLSIYIGNSPKYAIDLYLEPVFQTYFNILFMPSFVINLFSSFAFRPILTSLALQFNEKKFSKYTKTISMLVIYSLFLTFIVIMISSFIGIPLLNLVYSVNLNGYKLELLLLLLGGGISAVGTILYYSLTIMRKQGLMLISYIITAAVTYFLTPFLVYNFGFSGASIAYVIIITIRALIYFVILVLCYKKHIKEIE